MPAAAIAGAATIGGALISSNASKKAAGAQAAAADRATELQREMFERQVELQAPWRNAGISGLNRLTYLLGLSPTGYGGGSGLPTMESAEEIRARLLPRFTPAGVSPTGGVVGYPLPTSGQPGMPGSGYTDPETVARSGQGYNPFAPQAGQAAVDEAGLQAAIDAEMARQKRAYDLANKNAIGKAEKDPQYGSLLDKFGMDDFEADPGYQFRQDEGLKALERSAAARGGLLSGRAMKDTMRFSQGLASDEYGRSFDRFRLNQGDTFNRLAAIAGVGQTATQQTSAAAGRYGDAAAGNIIGAGNAMAAGRIGSANALTGAIGQGVSAYQNQQYMNMLNQPPAWGSAGGWTGGGRTVPDYPGAEY
jgi:hypothetical protein